MSVFANKSRSQNLFSATSPMEGQNGGSRKTYDAHRLKNEINQLLDGVEKRAYTQEEIIAMIEGGSKKDSSSSSSSSTSSSDDSEGNLLLGGAKKTRKVKKVSKKPAKKVSKKVSKKGSKKQAGGAKKSKKSSKKASKKRSQAREGADPLAKYREYVQYVQKDANLPGGPTTMAFIAYFRSIAKSQSPNASQDELNTIAKKIYHDEKKAGKLESIMAKVKAESEKKRAEKKAKKAAKLSV